MYTEFYVETRKHHMLWNNKVFCIWGPKHWSDMSRSALTGWGGHHRGCSYLYIWIMERKKMVLGWQPQLNVVSSAVSYWLKVPIMEKHILISVCISYIVRDAVLWLFPKTPLVKPMSSVGDLVIHSLKICLRYVYFDVFVAVTVFWVVVSCSFVVYNQK